MKKTVTPEAKKKRRSELEASVRQRPVAPTPTNSIPGTEEKIKVMAWRVSHRFQPFHPRDYREDRNPT